MSLLPLPAFSPLHSLSLTLPIHLLLTTMANNNTFLSFFILLFHLLSCFFFSSSRRQIRSTSTTSTIKKKITSTKKTISSYLKNLFSSSSSPSSITKLPPPPSIPSPSSSTRSLRVNPTKEDDINTYTPSDIFPCTICGEIFQTTMYLQHHLSLKHPISELYDGENIVRIIFNMGWPQTTITKTPTILKILKIHNNPKIITRFEDYRENVKSKASLKQPSLKKHERCIADGNELLRFHCTTFMCDLDHGICNQQYCSICAIIRNGFSSKMDGISTLPTSWRAHLAVPNDLEEEFKFMNVKRALIVCRVIAGRVGCDPNLSGKDDPGFDSLMGRGNNNEEEDELLVFNPKAVLPCFVIVYTV